ncbi:NADH-quinone oxidoreductase subunit A, partial [bacterium]|nr:NADH-quinone oxidoreductase subunit A [bacterium]
MGAAPVVEATSNEATSWLLTLEEGRVRLKDVEEAAQRSGPTAQVTEIEWVAGPPWRFPFFLFAEMLVFIGILLVGFVYIWVKGDLSWIKTTDNRAAQAADA